ncbi:hypothetical protein [uncultured Pseudoteredinibacter sp.]|uniref:hypothetical protein n=1 Tax=uncultured Pseudoteredinibacter sp. TaxID=1641701 RepID=UPI00261CEDC6|nr:hypothetical protein [uncultured Pseudoteredinibacter sp.]
MKSNRIRTLNVYSDWLEKAKYELSRFEQSSGVYDMANCFLTLNALPEWIEKSDEAPGKLKNVATQKILIMKGQNFDLDENKLDQIDHQLRLVRLFCNHAKHGSSKDKLEHISMSAPFPLSFPVEFEFLKVGSEFVRVVSVLDGVLNFWASELTNA